MKIETIDRNTADAYLAQLAPGLRINRRAVRNFTDSIKSGHWQVSHLGAVFDTKNRLISGAEQLAAISECGIPVELKVTRGESPENIKLYGRGLTRTTRDVLHAVIRVEDSRKVAPVLSNIIRYAFYGNAQSPTEVEKAHVLFGPAIKELNSISVPPGVSYLWGAPVKSAVALALTGHGHRDKVRHFVSELFGRREAGRHSLVFRRFMAEGYHKIPPHECFTTTLQAIASHCGLEGMSKPEEAKSYFVGLACGKTETSAKSA